MPAPLRAQIMASRAGARPHRQVRERARSRHRRAVASRPRDAESHTFAGQRAGVGRRRSSGHHAHRRGAGRVGSQGRTGVVRRWRLHARRGECGPHPPPLHRRRVARERAGGGHVTSRGAAACRPCAGTAERAGTPASRPTCAWSPPGAAQARGCSARGSGRRETVARGAGIAAPVVAGAFVWHHDGGLDAVRNAGRVPYEVVENRTAQVRVA